MSRGDPAWPPKVGRSSIHRLTSCLLIICPGDLAGTRQSQPLLSEFTVKNHQPRSHVKVGGLGPKDSVGVSCGGGLEDLGTCAGREWTKLRAAGTSRRQLGGFEVGRAEGLCKGPKVGGS